MRFDKIWLNARLATLAPERPGLGVIEPGAVAAVDGRIAFAGAVATCQAGGTRPSGSTSRAAGSRPD